MWGIVTVNRLITTFDSGTVRKNSVGKTPNNWRSSFSLKNTGSLKLFIILKLMH